MDMEPTGPDQKILSVAFLGPEATFSHEAAVSLYGESVSFHPAGTIEDVFDLVERGVCNRGVVPVENSYEGSVNITLDLFYKYDLNICDEIFMKINHHLLSRADSLQEIKGIYSHPMAAAQCRAWLRANLKGIPVSEVASTSLAAMMASGDQMSAAIGSRRAGLTHGLNILAENIEENPDNVTRFLSIGKTRPTLTGKDKTSFLFFLHNKPGALQRALAALADREVNMTHIESRPMRTKKWEYMFFVDIEGHEQERNVGEALKEMGERCVFMKILGSYPMGRDPFD